MVVPHYAYLKMKMLGPHGIITISRDLQNSYQCDLLAIENVVQKLGSGATRAGLCPHAKTGLGGSDASTTASQFLTSTSQRKEATTSLVHALGANRGPIIHVGGRFEEGPLGEN